MILWVRQLAKGSFAEASRRSQDRMQLAEVPRAGDYFTRPAQGKVFDSSAFGQLLIAADQTGLLLSRSSSIGFERVKRKKKERKNKAIIQRSRDARHCGARTVPILK